MLEPGPETDLKVAEACGIEAEMFCERCCLLPISYVTMYPKTFRHSTDLNDAFLAAEKAGLFDGAFRRALTKEIDVDNPKWSVFTLCPPYDYLIANEPTPALAICAAILKLKEKP